MDLFESVHLALRCSKCDHMLNDLDCAPFEWIACGHVVCTRCMHGGWFPASKCQTCSIGTEAEAVTVEDILRKNLKSALRVLRKTQKKVNQDKVLQKVDEYTQVRLQKDKITRLAENILGHMFCFSCAGCSNSTPQEKLRICESCLEGTIEERSQQQVLSCTFCADCSIELHMDHGHAMRRFHEWKCAHDASILQSEIKDKMLGSTTVLNEVNMAHHMAAEEITKSLSSATSFASLSSSADTCSTQCARIVILSERSAAATRRFVPAISDYVDEIESITSSLQSLCSSQESIEQ